MLKILRYFWYWSYLRKWVSNVPFPQVQTKTTTTNPLLSIHIKLSAVEVYLRNNNARAQKLLSIRHTKPAHDVKNLKSVHSILLQHTA